MEPCKRHLLPVITLLAAVWCVAQDTPQRPGHRGSSEPATVQLEVVSTVPVPSVPAEGIVQPVFCGPGNAIVTRLIWLSKSAPPVNGDAIVISSEGKLLAQFGKEKITDVPQPVPSGTLFFAGHKVYMFALGRVPEGHQTKWRTPTGEVEEQPAVRTQHFVTRFQEDGTYDRAVALDLPFEPLQLGVFENGDFLINGSDRAGNPRIAMVAPNGQLRRWIELKGDFHLRTESDSAQDKTALPHFAPSQAFGNSLFDVVSNSQIVSDGANLLLFRPVGSTVFSISPGGEVRTTKLNMPNVAEVIAVKPSRNVWIVEFTHKEPGAKAEKFEAWAFDPATGNPLTRYVFPNDLGWGLACGDGTEFTSLMADTKKNTIKVVKLAPAGQ